MAEDTGSVTDIFWKAASPESDNRGPVSVVRHALLCLEAFEAGQVSSPKTGKQVTLSQLLADVGMEEGLVYASPELARGESFDERSLVFTLGVLIFERLTDRHPFGTTDNVRLARIRRGEMGSGVNYFPQVPGDLRAVLMRAMGPFPEERFGSLKEMVHALRRFSGLSQPSIRIQKKQPKFFEAPTKLAPYTKPESQQASADWLQPRAKEEPPARTDKEPTAKMRVPAKELESAAGAGIDDAEVESLFDEVTEEEAPATEEKPTAAPPSAKKPEIKELKEILGPPEPKPEPPPPEPVPPPPAAGPVAEPSRPKRATERVEPVARPVLVPQERPLLNRLLPLIYGLAGAAIATILFLIFGGNGDGPDASKVTARPPDKKAEVTVVKVKTKPVTKPAPVAAKPEPITKPKPAAKTEPLAPAPGQTTAEASGTQVYSEIRSCFPEEPSSLRVAVFLQANGRVVRGFVSPRPGIDKAAVKCAKKKFKGMKLPLRLPKAEFVEWVFREKDGRRDVVVTKPLRLRAK